MSVKRFDFDRYDGMYLDDRGDFVEFTDYDALQRELAAAREALRRYGAHHCDCSYDPSTWNDGPTPCDCGLDAFLAATAPPAPGSTPAKP